MKRNPSSIVLLTLLFGMLLSGCTFPSPGTSSAPDLNGTEWRLTSLNGSPLPEKIRITLRFENGEVRGSAACNTYGGAYSQNGANLTFDQGWITEMGCEDNDLMVYEAIYMDVFIQVKSFRLENDVLSLLDENDAVILVYSLSPQFTPLSPDALPVVIETVIVTVEPPAPTAVPFLSAAQVRNATYQPLFDTSGQVLQLTDGQYQSADETSPIYISMSDLIAFGDLNGDGLEDAATLVGENFGGSGVFVSLVIYLNQGGAPVQAGAAGIDDRANIQAVSIRDGQVIVDGLIHSFSDPGCCPSMPVVRTYRLVGEGLTLLQQIQVLEDGSQRAITITEPLQGSQVGNSVRITGEVTVSPFENNLVYIIYDAQSNELARGPFAVISDGIGGPGTFDNTIGLGSVPAGQVFRIELQDLSMADGSILAMAAVILSR